MNCTFTLTSGTFESYFKILLTQVFSINVFLHKNFRCKLLLRKYKINIVQSPLVNSLPGRDTIEYSDYDGNNRGIVCETYEQPRDMVLVGDTLYYTDTIGYTVLLTDVVSSRRLLSAISLLVRR